MKGIYKVLGFVGVSLGLVALLLAGMVPAGGQDSPFKEIERNLRHPQGEIIELEGSLSFAECERFQEHIQKYKDAFWFVDEPQVLVGTFVQEFVYARDLIDDITYRDIHQDGTVKIGVTSRDVIEGFKELGIPITFEIIDLDEVRHLEEAAQEIAEKPYVMEACYSYSEGRITVLLTKPNWGCYEDIYREYPDSPLVFGLVDFQPEIDHGGGEEIRVASSGGTSGFLANMGGQKVMVTAGHLGEVNQYVYNKDNKKIGTTRVMKSGGYGQDAGVYTAATGVTFKNVISTLQIDGWAQSPPNVDDWIYYYSGYRGPIWCRVVCVDTSGTYIRYWRSDGGPGDSGSPVFTITGGIIIQGVHTHGEGVGHGSFGICTTIAQVRNMFHATWPG